MWCIATPPVQRETAKKETENINGFKGHLSLSYKEEDEGRGRAQGRDKTRAGERRKRKGPKQGQGEGEGRFCILMLKFREEKFTAANCLIPAVPDETLPDQETCDAEPTSLR